MQGSKNLCCQADLPKSFTIEIEIITPVTSWWIEKVILYKVASLLRISHQYDKSIRGIAL